HGRRERWNSRCVGPTFCRASDRGDRETIRSTQRASTVHHVRFVTGCRKVWGGKVQEHNMTWEERWHPLREEWVIVAAHRQDRPWSGEIVPHEQPNLPPYVADCYLCPGNARVGGTTNPQYDGVFVFDNDHPCVGGNAPVDLSRPSGINRNRPAQGVARVVCY